MKLEGPAPPRQAGFDDGGDLPSGEGRPQAPV